MSASVTPASGRRRANAARLEERKKKALWKSLAIKARDQSLESVSALKRAVEPKPCLHSPSAPMPTRGGDTIMTSFAFLVACNGLAAAYPPTLTDYFLHLFILRILRRGAGLFTREIPACVRPRALHCR